MEEEYPDFRLRLSKAGGCGVSLESLYYHNPSSRLLLDLLGETRGLAWPLR